MERLTIRVKETDPDLMVKGWEYVFRELFRLDLEPEHREYIYDTLNILATNCVNMGLGYRIAQVRRDIIQEEKIKQLKRAWENGEIAQ